MGNIRSHKLWTDEEKEILKENYTIYTNKELIEKFFPDRTIRSVECMASLLNIGHKTNETISRSKAHTEEQKKHLSEIKKEYYKTHRNPSLGKKRSEESRKNMSESKIKVGKWKGEDNPRHKNPLFGSSNGRWKGGILPIYLELRSDTKDWQKLSMEFCGYKCILSGGEFDNIHHLVPFRDIADETFKNLSIDVKNHVSDYTDEEMNALRNELKRLHDYYGYGVCLSKELHKLFHDKYGYTKTTLESFLDFVYCLDCGDYDDWLTAKNIKININYEIIEYFESALLKRSA